MQGFGKTLNIRPETSDELNKRALECPYLYRALTMLDKHPEKKDEILAATLNALSEVKDNAMDFAKKMSERSVFPPITNS